MTVHIDIPPVDDVTVNRDYFAPGDGIYIIHSSDHTSSLGFDVCLERIRKYSADLRIDPPEPALERGSLEAFAYMRGLVATLELRWKRYGERSAAELTPALMGLEGWRVEVVDEEGDRPRRFIVGISTGFIPIHLEISRRSAHSGGPARSDYYSVRQIEKVR